MSATETRSKVVPIRFKPSDAEKIQALADANHWAFSWACVILIGEAMAAREAAEQQGDGKAKRGVRVA